MKFYVYISAVKVDMIYDQISTHARSSLAGELKIDLRVVSASLKKNPIQPSNLSKLALVTRYIEKHEHIGTVNKPDIYFWGTMPMRWGPPEESALVYFGGETKQAILGLVGSRKHVIGKGGESSLAGIGSSFTPEIRLMLQSIRQKLFEDTRQRDDEFDQSDTELVAFATKHLRGPVQKMEFLAKRLIEGYDAEGKKKIVLGSPLYVSLAE